MFQRFNVQAHGQGPGDLIESDNLTQVKIVTIGDSGVGKTWLLLRWAGETGGLIKNANAMPTIGIDFRTKIVRIDKKRLKVYVVSPLIQL
jgi:GTPase SAR1 family protein